MEAFKAVFTFVLVILAPVEIASSICCEDIRSDIEQKELAHANLCSAVNSDLAQCCQDLGTDVEKQRQAYETLCPTGWLIIYCILGVLCLNLKGRNDNF